MIWFGKSFIEFCKSFINLIKLVSTLTCSSARVRVEAAAALAVMVLHSVGKYFAHYPYGSSTAAYAGSSSCLCRLQFL